MDGFAKKVVNKMSNNLSNKTALSYKTSNTFTSILAAEVQ